MLRSSTSTVGRCARVSRSASGTVPASAITCRPSSLSISMPQALADDGVVVGDDDGGLVAVGALSGGHGGKR